MKYKLHRHCLSSKWTITPGHMGETVVWSAKMWDRALGPAMSSASRADGHWWVLHYLISLRLKKKKRKGEGGRKWRPTSSLLLMESAEAELSWIIIFLPDTLMLSVSLRSLSITKAEWSHFLHRHVTCRGTLPKPFLILPAGKGEKSKERNAHTPVCFLQYEAAMERMQKSKLSHYKKTMEVSNEVFCTFLSANSLQLETGWNLYHVKKGQECVCVF